MGIELPPELADVAARAGVSWPEADEEAMTRSARAWRDAATSMNAVTSDADTTVRETLASVRGETGTAAAQHWSSFVEPDDGHLTATVRGMNEAADRLEHAAQQVGTAKVEIVRNLVALAQNTDAAQAAAAAGHPMALAGLDTAIRGTGVNVANIEANLVDAVQPASGVDMAAVTPPVNANPGPHAGPLQDVTAVVADTSGRVADLVGHPGQQADGLVGAGPTDGAPATGAPVDGAPVGPGRGDSVVGDVVQGSAEVVGDVAAGGRQVVDGVPAGVPAGVPPAVDGVTGTLPGDGRPHPDGHGVAGPVPIGPEVLPTDQRPDGAPGLRPGIPVPGAEPGWVSDDRPTPPTGTTVRAGFDVAPAAPATLPPGASAIPGVPVGPAPGVGGGQPGGPGVVGGPVLGGAPVLGGPGGGGGASGGPVPGAGAAAGAAPGGARPIDARPIDARPIDAAPADSRGKGAAGAAPAQPAVGKPSGTQVGGGIGAGAQPAVGRTGSVAGGPAGPGQASASGLGQPGAGRTGSGFGGSAGPGQAAGAGGVPAGVGDHAGAGRPATGGPGQPANPAVGGQPGIGRTGSGFPEGAPGSAAPGQNQPGAGKAGAGAVGSVPPAQQVSGQPGGQSGQSAPPGQPVSGPPGGHPGTGQPAPGKPGAQTVGQLGPPVQPAADQQHLGQPAPGDYPGQPVVRERDEALALFWVHMFPIGHMPVAADRPGRQVPPPPPELDYAAGLRFEPGDHPRTDLVEAGSRLAARRDGAPRVEAAEPLVRAELTALIEGYDPLGGEHERDWDRRYQVRFGSVTPEGIRPEGLEFAWPPCEQYPEGGCAEAEAEILDEGVEIDRFGPPEGRVFAAAGTAFAQRSLPPAHLDQGYRRYRVLRPLPAWRAVSAAWFAQPGGGVRYRTTHSAVELVALGYLADITREEP
jgi:hypothetical protein